MKNRLKLSCLVLLVFFASSGSSDSAATPSSSSTPVVSSAASRAYHYAGRPKRKGYPDELVILTNKGYEVGYDETREDPAWVAFRLFKVTNPMTHPRPKKFLTDTRTRARVRHQDYNRSGYDRGHMAPNYAIDTLYGAEAQTETFFMSNIVPQRPQNNRDIWRRLEQRESNTYANRYKEIWTTVGPLFEGSTQQLPRAAIQIPSAFYRIIVREENGRPGVIAWIIKQEAGREGLSGFLVSVADVERRSGLDFLSDLPDRLERAIEDAKPSGMW